MRIHVLGSGTSMGVPVIGCQCPVCTSDDPHNNRLRSSVAIEDEGRWLLIDCSIDFRQQILRDPLPRIDAVLLTHTHADHVAGIDDLRIYNWRQGVPMPIYSSAVNLEDLKQRFFYSFRPLQAGGGVPQLELHPVRGGEPFRAAGFEVVPVPIMHGKLEIFGYRIGPFAYLTDCSAIPAPSRPLLDGVETLIISALRRTPHPTHFSLDQSLEAAASLGVRRAFFTHIADEMDHAETNAGLPAWARLLYDGQVIEVETNHGNAPRD